MKALRNIFSLVLLLSFLFTTNSNAQCNPVADQNTILGKVFRDLNQDGINDGGLEVGIADIGVNLFRDVNNNDIVDSGDVLLASTTSESFPGGVLGRVELIAPEVIIEESIADFFNVPAFNGNNGTQNWSGDWIEVGENDGAFGGNVRIASNIRFGRNATAIDDITGDGLYRVADLSTFTTADLSFKFRSEIDVPSATYFSVQVQVSTDGIAYTTLDTLSFTDLNQEYAYDISSFISNNTHVRFIGDGPVEIERNNFLRFDDIRIDFTKEGFESDYIVAIDDTTIPNGISLTTPTFYPIAFNSLGEVSCDNDFGFFFCDSGDCAPDAVNDSVTMLQGESLTIDVLVNDVAGNNAIDPTSVTITTPPSYGSVTLSTTGEIIYFPIGNYFGTDSFAYQVCDDNEFTPLCDIAVVDITINENLIDACVQAAQNHLYYIPFPDNELRTALFNSGDGTNCVEDISDNVRRVTSIKSPYPGMVLIYDHWEDGYESDINNPVQATTQIWGDNDPINGSAPGYPDDYIPSGGNFVLDNTYNYNPRNAADLYFDGRDKILTSSDIAISTVAGDETRFEVQSAKTDIYDDQKFGTSFTVPFGEELGQVFQYTGLFIRAESDNTEVNVDTDNDGTVDSTALLNEGEVHFIDGGVQSGAAITSTKPVGVDLFFGGLDCFGTRQINLLPAIFLSDTYYSPVPTTNSAEPSVTYFYNNLTTSINIDWESNINTGTITVAGKSSASLNLVDDSAYKFTSQGGEAYVASQVIDSDVDGSQYDWAFNLISESRLTDFAAIAWAPGSLNNSRNDNPVWVTPTANTTIYVKHDGDLTSTTSSISPCGIPYDQSFTLNYLNYQKIFDTFNNDNDQSGLAVFTCDGTNIFAVYGEDPSLALDNGPSFDVGTSMQPLCLQPQIFANDDIAYGITNTSVPVSVLYNDTKFITNIDVSSVSVDNVNPPTNGSAVVNADGSITYTPNTNFVGVDTFEYSVCSLEFPGICDIANVTINISDCPTPTNRNLVFGQVYIDSNQDMINNDDNGIEGVQVNIYEDLNSNGIIDAGDLPLPTTPTAITDINGNYQFEVPTYTTTIEDDFSSSTYSGGIGWSGDWIEIGENDGPNSGGIQIISQSLLVRDSKSISRQINLEEAVYATVSFNVNESGLIDFNDEVKVEICTDNTFVNCQVLFFAADDFTSASISGIAIESDKLTANTQFHIEIDGYNISTEEFFIDDINILASVRARNILIETEASTVPSIYALSTDNIETASFPPGTNGTCEQGNDFGFVGCSITDPGLNITCDDNGTPLDATDDTYSFTLNPSGERFVGTYNVSGDVIGTGNYGTDTVFGPFNSTDGNKTISISDTSGNCELINIPIDISVSQCLSSNVPVSIDFDGVDDYLEEEAFMNSWNTATIMGWVKLDNTFSPTGPFNRVFGQTPFNIHIGSTLKARAGLYTGTSSTHYQIETTNPLQTNIWYHLSAVYDGPSGAFSLYINGEKVSSSFDSGIPNTGISSHPTYGEGEFTIGRDLRNSSWNYKGAIDEIRVFNIALTEDQIQRMVYQEIEVNNNNVRGTIIGKDIIDINTSAKIPWANLQAYYPMTNVAEGKTFDVSSTTRDLQLYNITTIQPQTAPMPFETQSGGEWSNQNTWLHGDVWDIEDASKIKDWSIIHVHDNVNVSNSFNSLGLIIDNDKTLTVNGTNQVNNSWYLQLDGTLDLQNDSQLVQGQFSDLVTSANGKILRRQEGNTNLFWYNYWTSPVGELSATTLSNNNTSSNNVNNTSFRVNMLKDANGDALMFSPDWNNTTPGVTSSYWLYNYQNGLGYWDWVSIDETTNIQPGIGYTQKGNGSSGAQQQYIFEGKPNNGTILIATDDVDDDETDESNQGVTLTTSLIGNPYPSALDARQFITDNAGIIQGTILLWEQWAGDSHYLAEYEGGYGYINSMTTARAYQHPDIPIADQVQTQGIKTPTPFIPVAQGFFVEVIADGSIEFNNRQRVFKQEELGESIFFRANSSNADSSRVSKNNPEGMQLIRFEFATSHGATRRFVTGFSNTTSDGFDYGYDGGLIPNTTEEDMGILVEDKRYVLQAFAPITPDKVIDLTFNASGNYTYSLNIVEILNIDNSQEIYLKDNLEGVLWDLRQGPYNFSANPGENNDRFDIVFQSEETLSNNDVLNKDSVFIYVNNKLDKLFVKGLTQDPKETLIINAIGQRIKTYQGITKIQLENGILLNNIASGVYFVNIKTYNEENQIIKKIIID